MKKIFNKVFEKLKKFSIHCTFDNKSKFIHLHSGPTKDYPVIASLLPDTETEEKGVIGVVIDIAKADPWIMSAIILELQSLFNIVLMEPTYYSIFSEETFYGDDAYKKMQEDEDFEKDLTIGEAVRSYKQLRYIYKKTNKTKGDLN